MMGVSVVVVPAYCTLLRSWAVARARGKLSLGGVVSQVRTKRHCGFNVSGQVGHSKRVPLFRARQPTASYGASGLGRTDHVYFVNCVAILNLSLQSPNNALFGRRSAEDLSACGSSSYI